MPRVLNWKALLLAPLLVPLLCSFALTLGGADSNPLFGFLFVLIIGCVISYGATLTLLLPCLFVLSCFGKLSLWRTGLLGLLLGVVVALPISLFMWSSSGPDSGPPAEPFIVALLRDATDPTMLLFPASGLITAVAYWLLAHPWRQRAA